MAKSGKKRTGDEAFGKKTRKKLGKTKKRKPNETKISYKSRNIYIPTQNLRTPEDDALVNSRNLGLKDLTPQLKHYNASVRKDALNGIKELIEMHPVILHLHMATIVHHSIPLLIDNDAAVRKQLVALFVLLYTSKNHRGMDVYVATMIVYVCSGLTDLTSGVRESALDLMQLMINHTAPSLFSYRQKLLPLFKHALHLNKNNLVKQLKTLGIFLRYVKSIFQSIKSRFSTIENKNVPSFQWTPKLSQQSTLNTSPDLRSIHTVFWSSKNQNTSTNSEQEAKLLQQESKYSLRNSNDTFQVFQEIQKVMVELWAESLKVPELNLDHIFSRKLVMDTLYEILRLFELQVEHEVHADIKQRSNLSGREEHEAKEEMREQRTRPVVHAIAEHLKLFTVEMLVEPKPSYSKTECELVDSSNISVLSVLSVMFGMEYKASTEWEKTFLIAYLDYLVDTNIRREDYNKLLQIFERIYEQCSSELQTKLWKRLTKGYLDAHSRSARKKLCVQFFSKIITQSSCSYMIPKQSVVEDWLSTLPRMLWDLGDDDPSLSMFLIETLHTFARNPKLENLFANIQASILPFFYTQVHKKNEVLDIFGPFPKLPLHVQRHAVQLLFYFEAFNSHALKCISKCIARPEVNGEIASIVVEVLRHKNTGIDLPEHVSFLMMIVLSSHSPEKLTTVLPALSHSWRHLASTATVHDVETMAQRFDIDPQNASSPAEHVTAVLIRMTVPLLISMLAKYTDHQAEQPMPLFRVTGVMRLIHDIMEHTAHLSSSSSFEHDGGSILDLPLPIQQQLPTEMAKTIGSAALKALSVSVYRQQNSTTRPDEKGERVAESDDIDNDEMTDVGSVQLSVEMVLHQCQESAQHAVRKLCSDIIEGDGDDVDVFYTVAHMRRLYPVLREEPRIQRVIDTLSSSRYRSVESMQILLAQLSGVAV
eukprot:gb/GECH01010450.1/.p1 GENE.gb/GECH01010450.1/~~gb/GECH01010450.1/.p1  ORF type:complete len:933 (+),score=221.80 gb/GECH01010450.1/:1-2799(+)